MTINEIVAISGFLLLVILMLMVDIGVFHKRDHTVSFREALTWTIVWISLALVTSLLIYLFGERIHGIDSWDKLAVIVERYKHPITLAAGDFDRSLAIYRQNLTLEFLTGYLIEYSLSVDNIFVFVMIFYSFGIDKIYYHRVLFWGILGAIVMRFLFIFVSAALIQEFEWVLLLFGALLVFTGVKMFVDRNKERKIDTSLHPVIRFTSRFFRVDKHYRGKEFFIRREGQLYLTSLFVVLLVVEFSDVVFAVDSVPAIFSITKDPYIVYFSNIFAIIGLRSLFFLLINILEKFRFLHIGLSVLLVFVGVKMIMPFIGLPHISTTISLLVVVSIITVSIIFSLLIPVRRPDHP